jgi:hypothetical protein
MRSHFGEPVHKACPEDWISKNPTEARLGRFASHLQSKRRRDDDHALADPEPPASPLWPRHGAKARPLTDAQKRRNRELLDLAQRKPRTRAA